jgi:hypothetical protein
MSSSTKGRFGRASAVAVATLVKWLLLVKLKPFCKVFGKMVVVVASMSRAGKKPREATIFGFTSVVQIAKWLLHGFSLEAVFLLGVWQGFCRSQWRSTWKSPAKGPLNLLSTCKLSTSPSIKIMNLHLIYTDFLRLIANMHALC